MRQGAFISLALLLAACGGSESVGTSNEVIAPQDFALLPCGLSAAERPCALAVAGGKRLLFGGASGIGETLSDADLRQLDAVFLFSLRAIDIEGLDEIRNHSWQAGRARPLPVYGPVGTDRVISGLNLAYEQADALRIVDEGIPPGGFDAAILIAGEPASPDLMFDTGDVQVQKSLRSDQSLIFDIVYQGQSSMRLQKCRDGDCTINDELSWPLQQTHFLYRHSKN